MLKMLNLFRPDVGRGSRKASSRLISFLLKLVFPRAQSATNLGSFSLQPIRIVRIECAFVRTMQPHALVYDKCRCKGAISSRGFAGVYPQLYVLKLGTIVFNLFARKMFLECQEENCK